MQQAKQFCVGCGAAVLFAATLLVHAEHAGAGEWESFTIEFETEHGLTPDRGKGGTQKLTIRVPADLKPGEALRGFMTHIRGLEDFAHRERLAICRGLMGEFNGPNQAMRDAAAKATGRAELKHAGAIVQGLSFRGRVAAHYAHTHPEHTLAVILDHSWTPTTPTVNPKAYEYGNLPLALGVPMFFSSSRNDSHQGFDRRALHYSWCTEAFRRHRQACTSVIHHERGGHNAVGGRELVEVWLEEVLALRVPKSIPTDGSAYKLVPIDPHRVGGLVVAEQAKDKEGLTIHTNVVVAPVRSISRAGECNWWIPGPKSAAMYVDWVKRNGGTIERDLSDRFPNAAPGAPDKPAAAPGGAADADAFLPKLSVANPSPGVERAQADVARGGVGVAARRLKGIVERNTDMAETVQAIAALKVIEDWLVSRTEAAEQLAEAGQAYEAAALYERTATAMRGDARAADLMRQRVELLRTDAFRAGLEFDRLEKTIEKLTDAAKQNAYKRFAEKHAGTWYAKLAEQRAGDLDG